MKYRAFGKTGLMVSEIGHGTWAMGNMWGARDDQQALAALRRGIERGVNFIDTAWVYGNGHSEKLVGKILAEQIAPLFVATKCPPKNMGWPALSSVEVREVFPPDHLIKMTEDSLKNLGVERIDLQQLHVWRDEWLEQDGWQEAVERLKAQGKIRCFGVSLNDHQPETGMKLAASGIADSIQVIFNLFDPTAQERLFPLCREKQVAVIARVPLDEGGLSGKLSPDKNFPKGDWRIHYFKGERLKETCERAARLGFLLQGGIQTLPQAALKFCLSDPAVSTVIAGMRSILHVDENTAVPELRELTAEDLKKVRELAWPRNFYPTYP